MSLCVLIVGAGKVGSNLARALLSEGYEIALVDDYLKLGGRMEREDWPGQALKLMAETTAGEVPAIDEEAKPGA